MREEEKGGRIPLFAGALSLRKERAVS